MVKAGFNQKRALVGGLLLLSLALVLGLVIVGINFSPPTSLPALSLPISLAVPGIMVLTSLPRWKQQEQRRQAAVQGEQIVLAIEQPTPQESVLSLPVSLKIRANRLKYLYIYGLFFPLFTLCASIVPILQGDYSLDLSQHGILIRYNVPKPVRQRACIPGCWGALEGLPEKAQWYPAVRLLRKGCASLVVPLGKMTIEDRAASTDV